MESTTDYYQDAIETYRTHIQLYGLAKTRKDANVAIEEMSREQIKQALSEAVLWRFVGGRWESDGEPCPSCRDMAERI